LFGLSVKIDFTDPEKATQEIISHSPEPQVFFAYSFKNKEFVEGLANDLREKGIRTWLPAEQIRPGDILERRIEEGIETSGYLIVIVSRASIESKWMQLEINMALEREQKGKWPKIIPVLIEDVSIPMSIHERVYIDFRQNYENGLKRVVETIEPKAKQYRKKRNSDTWHWCKNCSNYPKTKYEERFTKPTSGELCNECKSKEKKKQCRK